MSPLASQGVRGYPDWQRIENWDTPSLFSRNGFTGATDTSPVMDVSHFAYLGGFDTQNFGGLDATVTITWFLDPAGTVIVGGVQWRASSTESAYAQFRLPNLGPFAQMTWQAIAGNLIHTCDLIGTNRYHPLPFIPRFTTLLSTPNIVLGAGAGGTMVALDMYAGPVVLDVRTGATAWAVEVYTNTVANNFVRVGVLSSPGPASPAVFIIPPGPLQVNVTNLSAAAATINVTLTPSWSGAT